MLPTPKNPYAKYEAYETVEVPIAGIILDVEVLYIYHPATPGSDVEPPTSEEFELLQAKLVPANRKVISEPTDVSLFIDLIGDILILKIKEQIQCRNTLF